MQRRSLVSTGVVSLFLVTLAAFVWWRERSMNAERVAASRLARQQLSVGTPAREVYRTLGQPIRDEYFSADIAATVYAKLGLPHDLIVQSPDGRPVKLLEGREIKEWM